MIWPARIEPALQCGSSQKLCEALFDARKAQKRFLLDVGERKKNEHEIGEGKTSKTTPGEPGDDGRCSEHHCH